MPLPILQKWSSEEPGGLSQAAWGCWELSVACGGGWVPSKSPGVLGEEVQSPLRRWENSSVRVIQQLGLNPRLLTVTV